MTEKNEDFQGVIVNGTISHYSDGIAEQHDPQEFMDALDALLELDHVEAVRWYQYTPYFNDGDACTFSAGQFGVKLDVDEGEEDFDYGEFRSDYDLYSYLANLDRPRDYQNDKVFNVKDVDTKPIYDAIQKLEVLSQHHEAILSKKFGDPAEVTYDGEEFNVEYYEHD